MREQDGQKDSECRPGAEDRRTVRADGYCSGNHLGAENEDLERRR